MSPEFYEAVFLYILFIDVALLCNEQEMGALQFLVT